ncbi:MAG: hypothetical protein M0038_14435 [Pseudomonadota bacterium]|jgi:hypothetical protein|nr:hypothetical protein [Pseudomonadota bacterium]
MADDRLPLIRGRVTSVDTYEAPQRGRVKPRIPSLDPQLHRSQLIAQLNAIEQAVQARPDIARDELATREIIAVTPTPGFQLAPEQLDDARSDARLVGVVPDTGTVLLDVANANLGYFRDKVDAFADDTRSWTKSERDGTATVHRASERAVAPVESIRLANLADVRGPALAKEALVSNRAYWFEIACRGGYRRPLSDTESTRAQIARQLYRITGSTRSVDEFIGPEQVYFFRGPLSIGRQGSHED